MTLKPSAKYLPLTEAEIQDIKKRVSWLKATKEEIQEFAEVTNTDIALLSKPTEEKKDV